MTLWLKVCRLGGFTQRTVRTWSLENSPQGYFWVSHRSLTNVHTPIHMLLFPLSLCSLSPSLPWQWLHAWTPTLPPITYRRKLYSPGGCFPLFKAAKGPAFLSAILMAYLTVYPTLARVFGKPFPICYKVLDYLSPTILSHWPSKYLCTNFLIGAFRWNKSKSNSDPIIPVRQPCKILQAKSESTYLTLKFGWCWSQPGRLEYLKKSHFQFINF